MINEEISRIFKEMGDILEINNEVWPSRAYHRAAQTIGSLPKDLEDMYKEGGLKAIEEINGIGKTLAEKIEEFIKTKKLKAHEELRASINPGLLTLLQIHGMGPKKVKKLYNELNINSIKDLKDAIKKQKIRNLKGFGEKSELLIKEGIDIDKTKRISYKKAISVAKELVKKLIQANVVVKVEIAGSLRRKKSTIKDIDILCISDNVEETVKFFITKFDVKKVIAKGKTKAAILLNNKIQVDLRIIKENEWGSALNYFTGSKEHNVYMRQVAISKGMKLNEYGLFDKKTDKLIASKSEEEIYDKLGFDYIPPDKREVGKYIEFKTLSS